MVDEVRFRRLWATLLTYPERSSRFLQKNESLCYGSGLCILWLNCMDILHLYYLSYDNTFFSLKNLNVLLFLHMHLNKLGSYLTNLTFLRSSIKGKIKF